MKKIIHFFIIIICVFTISCENSISDLPIDYYDAEDILTDSIYTMGIVNRLYSELPDGYNRLSGNSMVAATTDEAVQGGLSSAAQDMALGIWTATNLCDDAWTTAYSSIRKANLFLNEFYPAIPDYLFKSQQTIDRLVGQVYFFRAMFYFELVKRYGGVPIITDVLSIDDDLDMKRDSYDDCIEFIVDQCDRAAAILPENWEDDVNDYGRATKGAALALKSRVLLYAASPLFNDSANPENTVEHGLYDETKWVKAAEAAHDVINMGAYSLYYNFDNFFTTIFPNSEVILLKMSKLNNSVEKNNGPTGFTNGGGGTCPSLELVDAFEMADGTTFDWENPVHASNPFLNREQRFYATILYNDETWMGRKVETFEGGVDMGAINSTKTGFYLRKFLNEDAKWFGGSTGTTYHCFPLIRYAEILLNYAEAMNEAYGPDAGASFGLSARDALNQVRSRASVPEYEPGMTKEEMRGEIQRERQVELAFEEHRHLDLRRWKLADAVLSQPVHGLKIEINQDGTFSYTQIVAQDRVFRAEMSLYPIPQVEINRNKNLIQNSGW